MNELRAGTPLVVAGVTLIPVERLRLVANARRQACWFQATKEAFALVICDAHRTYALDAGGHPLSIDHLFELVPKLQAKLPIEYFVASKGSAK